MRTGVLTVLLVAGLAVGAANVPSPQELHLELLNLFAQVGSLQSLLHEVVEQAKADGQLDSDEQSKIEELKDKLNALNAQISQLVKRDDPKEDERKLRSFNELTWLLNRAVGFIYVASDRVDPELARALSALHIKLITKRFNPLFPILGGPFAQQPLIEYANRTVPVVPGVVVLTNEKGWPDPINPYDYNSLKGEVARALLNPLTAPVPTVLLGGPLVRALNDAIQSPTIFFDTVDIEYRVRTINIAIGPITIPLPWEARPVTRYRLYIVSTDLIRDRFASVGTYTYMEKNFEQALGPFLSALFAP